MNLVHEKNHFNRQDAKRRILDSFPPGKAMRGQDYMMTTDHGLGERYQMDLKMIF